MHAVCSGTLSHIVQLQSYLHRSKVVWLNVCTASSLLLVTYYSRQFLRLSHCSPTHGTVLRPALPCTTEPSAVCLCIPTGWIPSPAGFYLPPSALKPFHPWLPTLLRPALAPSGASPAPPTHELQCIAPGTAKASGKGYRAHNTACIVPCKQHCVHGTL